MSINKKIETRRLVSAIVGLSFAAVMVTGLLLLLHIKGGAIMAIHEWIGLLFAAGAAAHVVLNGKALLGYLRRPHVRVALLITTLLIGGLGLYGAGRSRSRRRAKPATELTTRPAPPSSTASAAPASKPPAAPSTRGV